MWVLASVQIFEGCKARAPHYINKARCNNKHQALPFCGIILMLVFYPSMPGVLRAKTAQIWAGARRTLSKICATRASPLPATCPLTSAARLAISLVSSGLSNIDSGFDQGKIAKQEGSPIFFTKEEGLCTGTAVNGPIVAVALASY